MTTLTSDTGADAAATRETSSATSWPRLRLRPVLLAVAFPVALLAIWHFATSGRPASLIPPPYDVWLELQDLTFGGINDDAYSKTLHIHLLASVSRVYGGFALALIVALPLGMLIGRVSLIRQLIDPTIQLLRPVPVTAWLPLAMIIFGLGPRSAFFLVEPRASRLECRPAAGSRVERVLRRARSGERVGAAAPGARGVGCRRRCPDLHGDAARLGFAWVVIVSAR